MTYALVDNATLTGVQRILGEAPAKSLDAVDGDLAALENLVVAILLYDEVVAIDDYKPEYRAARARTFPFVRFLDPRKFGLPEVAEAADHEGERVAPIIRGGQFEEDFRAMLEALKVHMVCTWNVYGSVYQLIMNMLGRPNTPEFGKYGKISASIFGELHDQLASGGKYDSSAHLVASNGQVIDQDYVLDGISRDRMGGVSPALAAFLAALRWLAQRTIYYALAAEHLQGDAVLYPVRQAYHRYYMLKTGRYDGSFVAQVVEEFSNRTTKTVEAVINANRASHVRLSIPLFSAWLVQESGDVRQVLAAARQLRNEDHVIQARAQLKEIRVLYDAGATASASRKIQSSLDELDAALSIVRRRYGLRTQHGITVATVIKVLNVIPGVGLPEVGDSLRLPWDAASIRQKGVGALYRDLGSDLADFPKLGAVRDMLAAALEIDPAARVATPRAEDPRYRNARVDWKRQM